MRKFLSVFMIAVLCIAVFSGCESKTQTSSIPSQQSSLPASSQEASSQQELIPEGMMLNALTGEYTLAEGSATLPVSVMICNDAHSKSQPGIDKADLYIETETEGGISRILTVFPNVDSIPSILGPCRSARTPFVQMALSMGFVFAHAGGSPKARAMASRADVMNIDFLRTSTSFRDSDMRAKNSNKYDHCLATNAELLSKCITKKNYGTEKIKEIPWQFTEQVKAGDPANTLQIAISNSATGNSYFVYDEKNGLYRKNIGTAENHRAHRATEGGQIAVNNIVILYAERYVEGVDSYTRYSFKLDQGGEAVILSGGQSRTGSFNCTDEALTLKEADGSTLQLLRGKTYIYIINQDIKDRTIIGA